MGAATAVVWGRSPPGRTFEQIAGEAHASAERFLRARLVYRGGRRSQQRLLRSISGAAE
jgi:hypothetical protein